MRRREFLVGAASSIALAAGRHPNLLIITNDQHRADCLGCYGNAVVRTPALDRLAREGTLWENYFVQAPQCVPSRASMLTGRYPHQHRAQTNSIELPAAETTLPQILAAAGYRTAAVGEMPFAPQKGTAGFAEILASSPEYDAFLEASGWRGAGLSEKRSEQFALKRRLSEAQFQAASSPVPEELDETAFWSGKACDFLRAPQDKPFYLHVNFRRPHHPFDPPAPFDTMYRGAAFPPSVISEGEMVNKPTAQKKALAASVGFDLSRMTPEDLNRVKAMYYGMISLNDKYIGKIFDTLRTAGLDSNTVVVFNADHGEMLGDHGLLFKGSYMYDGVLRVPLIIRAPGRVPAGRRVPGLAEEVDLLPALLDLLGVDVPGNVKGWNLLRHEGKDWVHAEFPTVKCIRSREWKLVEYGSSEGELYDLRHDPDELRNLWDSAEHAPRRQELSGLLLEWKRS
jgi:hypothetical protein